MKSIGININESKDKDGIIYDEIVKNLKEVDEKIIIHKIEDINDVKENNIDIILVFGGDGTILNAGRKISPYCDIPLLGINIGHLGFMTTMDYVELKQNIKKILNKEYTIENRLMLKGIVENGKDNKVNSYAVNDLVICRGTLSRAAIYKVLVNGSEYAEFKGDGIIISTPTGSTAYSFSAGGPIVYPTLRLIGITPICPHSPSVKPILLNEDSVIKITSDSKESTLYVAADGQKFTLLDNEFTLTITKCERDFKIAMINELDYFEVLNKKIIQN